MTVSRRNAAAIRELRKWTNPENLMVERRQRTSPAKYLLTVLLTSSVVGPGCWLLRDHQLSSNTRSYTGVTVVSQQSDRRYGVIVPGYQKVWDWEFCHPLKMPAMVVDIQYEQKFGCKNVNGTGFVSIHKEDKNAKL
jgi:hypothetical protein